MSKENGSSKQQLYEQNITELKIRKNSSSNNCDICFQPYHIMERWPMLACPNSHYFCDHCIDGMFKYNANQPVPCPICRALIRVSLVKPHYQLFRHLNKQITVKNALKQTKNELFLYAFQNQIFQVASAFKQGRPEAINKFTKLDISNRKISKILHMQSFPSLIYLNFDKNNLETPLGLQSLKYLRFLNLNHNNIKDITILEGLKHLRYLSVQFNQIQTIPTLIPFFYLSHWFLLGNPLRGIVAEQFLLVQFQNLMMLSLSVNIYEIDKIYEVFLKGISLCETMPKLYRLFVPQTNNIKLKNQIEEELHDRISITWVSTFSNSIEKDLHNDWISRFMSESFQYGQVFQFKMDSDSPFSKQYQLKSNKLVKLDPNFTIVNSSHSIQKQGKVNFKFKVQASNNNMVVGLCNAFLKHNANIYSEHFVGLTFWGGIYVRGEYSTLTGKLRLEEKPVIRMSVDFQQNRIKWFSDDIQLGNVAYPEQFKYSSLYFLIGMRDPQTSVQLLNQ